MYSHFLDAAKCEPASHNRVPVSTFEILCVGSTITSAPISLDSCNDLLTDLHDPAKRRLLGVIFIQTCTIQPNVVVLR